MTNKTLPTAVALFCAWLFADAHFRGTRQWLIAERTMW